MFSLKNIVWYVLTTLFFIALFIGCTSLVNCFFDISDYGYVETSSFVYTIVGLLLGGLFAFIADTLENF